jgi:hypothetical protein
MKCEACLNQLEEYVDGELARRDAEAIGAHLITCADCSGALDQLTAEQEVYARYDRELEISPSLWSGIEARIAGENDPVVSGSRFNLRGLFAGLLIGSRVGFGFAGATAVVIAAIVVGVVYVRTQKQSVTTKEVATKVNVGDRKADVPQEVKKPPTPGNAAEPKGGNKKEPDKSRNDRKEKRNDSAPRRLIPREGIANATPKAKGKAADQSDVFYSAIAYSGEDVETQKHIERVQMLLRSIRNAEISGDDDAVDVSYEKALSRRLLSENIVLRRDAEMNGKFPVKTLLSDLEPFLIDIANLQDRSTPDELRAIKDRVRKTEIVATLQSY